MHLYVTITANHGEVERSYLISTALHRTLEVDCMYGLMKHPSHFSTKQQTDSDKKLHRSDLSEASLVIIDSATLF